MLTTLAHGIGKGLVAGFAGTAAMTISSTIEQKVRGRESSSAPAKVTERALGIDGFKTPQLEQRFSTLVHWGVGSGWGVRAESCGLRGYHPAPHRRATSRRCGAAPS